MTTPPARQRQSLKILAVSLLAVCPLLPCQLVYAQVSDSGVVGTVTDPSGARMPGVLVSATSLNAGLVRTTQTTDTGSYAITHLPIGPYRITAELPGFKKSVLNRLDVEVQKTARVDFRMQIGEISTELTVSSGVSPLLQTEEAQVGTFVENQKIVELPLNGRNFTQLVMLVAGAQRSSGSGARFGGIGGDRPSGVSFNVNGRRATDNMFLLDGIPVKEFQHETPSVSPSIDALQEFRVQTSNSDTEFGAKGGAQVNMVTKAGTNDLHGTLYHFIRNDVLDARNFFAAEKSPFKRNQFGAAAGGPIRKDRLFFFASYEGTRLRQGLTQLAVVPEAPLRAGDFSSLIARNIVIVDPVTRTPFDRNVIPAGRMDSVTTRFLQDFVPLPNRPGEAFNWVSSTSQELGSDQGIGRLDYNLGSNHRFFGRYIRETFTKETAPLFPWQRSTTVGTGENWGFGHTATLGSNKVNEFRFGVSIFDQDVRTSRSRDVLGQLGMQGLCEIAPLCWGPPSFAVSGFNTWSEGPAKRGWANDIYIVNDTFSYTRGAHRLKVGVEVQRFLDNFLTILNGRGTFSFDGRFSNSAGASNASTSFADFLLGLPRTSSRNIDLITPDYRGWGLSPWIQDNWKVTPNLTLSLGLRWEWYQRPVSESNAFATVIFPTGAPPRFVTASQADQFGLPRALFEEDWNNLAPRVGFAWVPRSSQRLVIRAAYGIFYNKENANTWINFALNSPFTRQSDFVLESTRIPSFSLKTPFALATVTDTGTTGGDQHWRDGYVQQWNLNTQFGLTPSLVVQAGYVGSKGTKFPIFYDANQAALGTGTLQSRRPYAGFGAITYFNLSGTSSYHGMLIQAEKRYSEGLSFLTSYTLGKCIDTGSRSAIGERDVVAQNVRNLRAEKSLCSQDVRESFVHSVTYELPFFRRGRGVARTAFAGWQLGGIMTLSGGQPFTVLMSGDPNSVGGNTRPNLTGDPNQGPRTPIAWFNTGAFAAPAAQTFGTAGRNIVTLPPYKNLDFSASKSFRLGESRRIQLRAEFFNVLNHPNFCSEGNVPGNSFGTGTFGTINRATEPRDIQFGLKYIF